MTINTTTSRIDYAGDGMSTSFAVPFPFFDASDLIVTERVAATGAETTKTPVSQYTVSGGNGAGGTITAGTAPDVGVTWSISRQVARTQLVDYVTNDPFPAETHERALDRLTCIAQDLAGVLDRSIRERRSEPTTGLELPSRLLRAGKFIGFDGAGDIIVSGLTTANGVTVTPFSSSLLDDADAAEARATLGAAASTYLQTGSGAVARAVADKLRDVIHPEEFGILPGNADNAPGFAALAAALNARGGGVVLFPPNQTYNCFDNGATAGTTVLMALANLRGLRIDMNGSKIRTARDWISDATTCRMFQLTDCEDFDLRFEAEQATGATTDTPVTGHIGVYLINRCRRGKIRGKMYGGRGGVEIVRGSGFSFSNYAENFEISLDCEHVFYPIAFQRNGRSAEIDLVARAAGRSLYLANASNIEARVWTNNTGLFDDIVVTAIGAASEGTANNACDNIRLDVTHRPDVSAGTGVFSVVTLVFQQIDPASPLNPCRLSNIRINVDADYSGAAAMPNVIVYAATQKDSGGTPATDPTTHQATNLHVSGSITGMTGSNPIIDWFRSGSAALVGSAVCGAWHFRDIAVVGAGTPAFFVQRDVVDFDLTLANIYAPGSSMTWAGTLPAGVLDASQGVNLSNLKSVGAGYRLLPAGRMRQWGVAASVAAGPTNVAVTLPAAFRAGPGGAIAQAITAGTTDQINISASSTQVTINRPAGSAATDVYWEVEGEL